MATQRSSSSSADDFADRLLVWFTENGRHDLPWQQDRSPYRVWISEIMLQQTRVATVIPYYERFMGTFPDLLTLADADIDEVLGHWTGLGYYSRARNLHRAAGIIRDEYDGVFPSGLDDLMALPGIGESTAGAILAQSFGQQQAILDGNVKRVLARYHAVEGWPGVASVQKRLWALARQHTPAESIVDYTQAIMDLGATICSRSNPSCSECPLVESCEALRRDEVAAFPGRKPKKEKPVRQVRMLIVEDESGSVLLVKRPPTGIWGGLWCLPELEHGKDIDEHIRSSWSCVIVDKRCGETFRHSFSHYHLDISPCWLKVSMNGVAEIPDAGWKQREELAELGMPKPAVMLLGQ